MSSLNPVFTVGQQLAEPLMKHLGLSRRAALERAEALLVEVGMPGAEAAARRPIRTSSPAASSSA